MRALRFLGPNRPMEIQDVPEPTPAPGWAVIRVRAAGLCHSDLHILDGSLEYTMATEDGRMLRTVPPITLGHESAGTVHALGEGVERFAVGDRVVSGGPMIPESAPGLTVDGGFAEYLAIPATKLQAIPATVRFEDAAVASDSIGTAYSAVRSAGGVQPGETVGIVGLGGLGLSGLRAAVLAGAEVYGVDINEAVFAAATDRGAKACFTDVRALRDLRPDLVVDFAGTGTTTELALAAVKPRGRVVVAGLAAHRAQVDTHELILNRKTLRGSLGRSAQDLVEVVDLLAQGELLPTTTEVPLADLDEAYRSLERGEVVGRLFTRP